jgi:hypothetical protein
LESDGKWVVLGVGSGKSIKKEAIPTEVRFVVATDGVREGCD